MFSGYSDRSIINFLTSLFSKMDEMAKKKKVTDEN